MDILRNLFGHLTSGIIRLAVTVGILAAAYFFIVKPVLETTDKAIDSANRGYENSFGTQGAGITEINRAIEGVNRRVQREVRRSFRVTKASGNPKRLVRCIERSEGDVVMIKRCTVKF